jgi:hypothetical protein
MLPHVREALASVLREVTALEVRLMLTRLLPGLTRLLLLRITLRRTRRAISLHRRRGYSA